MSAEYSNISTTVPLQHNMGFDRSVALEDETSAKPGAADVGSNVSPAVARRRVLGNLGIGRATQTGGALPQVRTRLTQEERDEQTRRFPVLNVLDRPVSNDVLKSYIPVESLEVPAFFGPCEGKVKTHYDEYGNPSFREPVGTIRQKFAPATNSKDEVERIKTFIDLMSESGPAEDSESFTRQDFNAIVGRLYAMLREPQGAAKVKAKLYELTRVQNFKIPGADNNKKCDGSLIDWAKIARVEKFMVDASEKIRVELKKQFPWSFRDMIIYASEIGDATPAGCIPGYVKRSHATRLWIPTWYRFDAVRNSDGHITSITVGNRSMDVNAR